MIFKAVRYIIILTTNSLVNFKWQVKIIAA